MLSFGLQNVSHTIFLAVKPRKILDGTVFVVCLLLNALFLLLFAVKLVIDDDMEVILLTSHNRAEIDHIRLLFIQIRVENLKRGQPGFQVFAYFMMFLTSSDLRTNHSTVF